MIRAIRIASGVNRFPPVAPRARRGADMQFEVEIYENEMKEWIATAVAYDVTVKGRTEKEALALLMEALATHFKKAEGRR
jgi:hypothetical protein